MSVPARSAANLLLRAAAVPALGYPLLLCWQQRWLPVPRQQITVRLRDHRVLRCDLADQTQRTMSLGLFEPAETSLVTRLLKPGDVFIDVGAHIGWFSTVAARQVGETGQVIACEPYPQNASALRMTLALNGVQNVRVIEAAVGSHVGQLSLAAASDSGSVSAAYPAHGGRQEVQMTTLDQIAADIPAVALVKIDVEGWEPRVLRGAVQTLSRTRNVLIELNRPALSAVGSSSDEVIALLRAAGFTRFDRVVQSGFRRLLRSREVVNVLAGR